MNNFGDFDALDRFLQAKEIKKNRMQIMRLIDADALKESVNKNLQGQLYGFEVYGLICDAPTIDAIPTDWLDRLMQDGTPEESKAAWRVLRAWRKEQEADHD